MSLAKLFVLPVCLALTISSAAAQSPYPTQERRVALDLRGLDLKDPRMVPIALARIEVAASHACGIMPQRDPAYVSAPQFVSRDFARCQARAVAETVASLHHQALTQAYAEAHGQNQPQPASSR
jgi:UrcA family protein